MPMASLNIRGVRQKTPPTKTNDVDKDVINIKDNLKIKLGDTKISISTIHIIIRECIEMLENLNIPGSEKRKHALIIIKTLMDDLSDNKEQHEFIFIKGPVFSQVVLADEINRSSAKTQSALLEAMEENQVSIDRQTYPLEQPFFVIATQNPRYQAGTFSLPESQLDRFLMCLQLGYPDAITERKILSTQGHREALNHIQPLFSVNELINLQLKVSKIHVADAVLDIVQAILKRSRESQLFITGLSPRAGIALINAAKAWAFIHNRSMVIADDIQQVLLPVITHRLQSVDSDNLSEAQILEQFNDIKMF